MDTTMGETRVLRNLMAKGTQPRISDETLVNDTSPCTIESKILKDARTQMRRILDLLPESCHRNIKTRERKEIKDKVTQLFASVHQMYGIVSAYRVEREEQNNILPNLLETMNEIKIKNSQPNQFAGHLTYAEVTKSNLKPSNTTKTINNNGEQGGNSAVLVYPSDEEEGARTDIKEITEQIFDKIQPHKIRVKIKEVKLIRDNGVCIRVGSEEDGKKLKEEIGKIQEIKDKIKCRTSGGKRPRVILLNVPQCIPEEEIIEVMTRQNDIWRGLEKDNIEEKCTINTVIKGKKTKENCHHVVISVTPSIRNILIAHKTISMAWTTIRVDDFVPVRRCYRCCGFGHMARDCTEQQRCSHCSRGHRFKECQLTNTIPSCHNCKLTNRNLPPEKKLPTNHNAFSAECPVLIKLKTQIIKRIDYGI
ncbi:uncharacterized protein LOC111617923 [Centruroides sculpturatus]|uniref:uncharacterized protein LOC111617923 n=1 Tax=Centruroides sculpturatus TaxID=218467 RepID=UPI000C6E26FF|nr:uncharacterized protein LOC111617923 [Centruroides sculpturatus]